MFLMAHGYFPPGVPVAEWEPGFAPNWARKRIASDPGWDGQMLATHLKVCPHCGNEWPESPAFWPRNKYGRGGLYSLCLCCKRDADNGRYRRLKFIR